MSTIWLKRAAWFLVLGLVLAGLVWLAWPSPVAVDLAAVARGPMEVTVDDDGKTEVRHVYTVSAPIGGKVLRISHPHGDPGVSRHVGDLVTANETVVAVMQPTTPSFIDVRSREEAEAAVAAADASVKYAQSEVHRLEAAVTYYRTEFARAQTLARSQVASAQALDKAKFDAETNEAALASANAPARDVARTSVLRRTGGWHSTSVGERARVDVPTNITGEIEVFLNGVRQTEG